VSPQRKARLAREHFDRAQTAFDAGDLVVAITFLHLDGFEELTASVQVAVLAADEIAG